MMNNVILILRHVCDISSLNAWILCYRSVKHHYPHTAVIAIDTGSIQPLIDTSGTDQCQVIYAQHPQNRLFAPLYEFITNDCCKLYDRAIIIHDGIIFQSTIDFSCIPNSRFIWHFVQHDWDNSQLETYMIKTLTNNEELLDIYNGKKWHGCLGGMLVISRSCAHAINSKYSLLRLHQLINNQTDAIAYERVIAVLCYAQCPDIELNVSLEGDISGMPWGYRCEEYLADPEKYKHARILKLFGART